MTAQPMTSPAQTPHPPPPGSTEKRRHHWWRWVAGVATVLLVVFVGAAWYFSGRIHSGALAATPAPDVPAFDDVRVVAVDGFTGQRHLGEDLVGSVTLARGPDAPYNFDAPAAYTLVWGGKGADAVNLGHAGPATKNPDGTVTRSLFVTSGPAPVVGQLAAQIRPDSVGAPKGGWGVDEEDVMIGDNPASFLTRNNGSTPLDTMAIIVHGQNGNRSNGERFVGPALQAGLPTLVITYRNDLGAAPDPSGRLQYGQTEWRDLDAAVTWARERGATNIVLIGESMGGAIVAAFLEESDQADVVSKVVLDAPMLSLDETISWNAREAMPVTGGAVPAPLLWAAEQVTSLRYGVDWSKVDYLDDTSWLQVPTLVIQGTGDERVPVTVARAVKDAAPDLVQLEEFPNAQHTEAWNWDPARFQSILGAFLAST